LSLAAFGRFANTNTSVIYLAYFLLFTSMVAFEPPPATPDRQEDSRA
jgi:hypothetical protein